MATRRRGGGLGSNLFAEVVLNSNPIAQTAEQLPQPTLANNASPFNAAEMFTEALGAPAGEIPVVQPPPEPFDRTPKKLDPTIQKRVREIDDDITDIDGALEELLNSEVPGESVTTRRLGKIFGPGPLTRARTRARGMEAMATLFDTLQGRKNQLLQERRLLEEPNPYEERLAQATADAEVERAGKAYGRASRAEWLRDAMESGMIPVPDQVDQFNFIYSGDKLEEPEAQSQLDLYGDVIGLMNEAANLGAKGIGSLPRGTGRPEIDALVNASASTARDFAIDARQLDRKGAYAGFDSFPQLDGAIRQRVNAKLREPGNIRRVVEGREQVEFTDTLGMRGTREQLLTGEETEKNLETLFRETVAEMGAEQFYPQLFPEEADPDLGRAPEDIDLIQELVKKVEDLEAKLAAKSAAGGGGGR